MEMKRKVDNDELFKAPLSKPKLSQLKFNREAAERRNQCLSKTSIDEEVAKFDRLFEQSTFDELKSAGFSSDFSQFIDYMNYAKLLNTQQTLKDTRPKSQSSFYSRQQSSTVNRTPSPYSRSTSPMSAISTAYSITAPPPSFLEKEQRWVTQLREKIQNAININVPLEDAKNSILESLEIKSQKSSDRSNFPPLTSDIVSKVKKALNSSGQTLITKFNIDIRSDDIHRLRDGQWLNDEIINFYGSLILERSKLSKTYPNVHYFNSFFYSYLKKNGYQKVRRWTKKFDLFSLDMALFPVHLGVHWCLGAIDFRKKTIEYYDSMHGLDRGYFDLVRGYLEEEHKDKKGSDFSFEDWKEIAPKNIPAQENGFDCGVFTVIFAEYKSRNEPFDFSQKHMKYFRQRIVYEIITGGLLIK